MELIVRLDQGQATALRNIAADEGVTMQALVVLAVAEYVERHPVPTVLGAGDGTFGDTLRRLGEWSST